jgi:hypothetical protein
MEKVVIEALCQILRNQLSSEYQYICMDEDKTQDIIRRLEKMESNDGTGNS